MSFKNSPLCRLDLPIYHALIFQKNNIITMPWYPSEAQLNHSSMGRKSYFQRRDVHGKLQTFGQHDKLQRCVMRLTHVVPCMCALMVHAASDSETMPLVSTKMLYSFQASNLVHMKLTGNASVNKSSNAMRAAESNSSLHTQNMF